MKNHKPILCTLTPAQLVGRGSSWRKVAMAAIRVEECRGGYLLTFGADEGRLSELAELVAAEQACCEWMNLELVRGEEIVLTMTADSTEGAAVIKAMLGV